MSGQLEQTSNPFRASPVSLDGFPSLASFIASDKDRTSLIFRRFDRLAARNILYLQSELVELEALQDQYDREDQSIDGGDLHTKRCAMDWEEFKGSAMPTGVEKQQRRMKLVKDIRAKMKEYRKALLSESLLASLEAPPDRNFESLMYASTRPVNNTDQRDSIFGGHSATLYSSNDDMVLLKHPEHRDRLTSFVEKHMPIFFISERSNDDMAFVSQRSISRFVTIVSIVLSIVLLFSAIVALYLVSSPAKKLVILGLYVVLFASSVGLLTTAKKTEIFAATAAYAAVLVVFVSGSLGSESLR
ncbi:hypothetical protein C7974DRAFT_53138 [Boeremia exigua]|uniref:uncharacterized protein n=1 Tax=Boeremia exigua TaxID=749465 RepID=UPI001E8D65D9|nr:uncharacterized protein C7974DRAFT_53138 [Boeremia exigua]KAH6616830.1 hypothetical protein C7974DRAFT_53138 [Boeremia exigua]